MSQINKSSTSASNATTAFTAAAKNLATKALGQAGSVLGIGTTAQEVKANIAKNLGDGLKMLATVFKDAAINLPAMPAMPAQPKAIGSQPKAITAQPKEEASSEPKTVDSGTKEVATEHKEVDSGDKAAGAEHTAGPAHTASPAHGGSHAVSEEGAEKKAWGNDEKLTLGILAGHAAVIGTEVLNGVMEMAKAGGGFLSEVGHVALGSISGGFGVVNGARLLYKAYNADVKTGALSTASKDIAKTDPKGENKELQDLKKALDFCKGLSETRSQDLKVSGSLEIATGVTTIVGASTGVGSPAGLVMAGISLAVSVGTKCYRGYEQTRPAYTENMNKTMETLKTGIESMKKNIESGTALSDSDKAMFKTLQSVGMMPKEISVDSSPADIKKGIEDADKKTEGTGQPKTFECLGEAGIKKVFMQETSSIKGLFTMSGEAKLDTLVGILEVGVNVLEKLAEGG